MTSCELQQDAFDIPGLRNVPVDDGDQPPAAQSPAQRSARRNATIDDGMNPEFVAGADFDGILGIQTPIRIRHTLEHHPVQQTKS